MKNIIKYSVIIPTFNREEVIGRAVKSVAKHKRDDVEVVIVDDGSTDNTRKKLEELGGDKQVRVFYLGENKGVNAARMKAIREARGEWVCLLDSDDEYIPEQFSKMLDTIERYKDYDFIGFQEIFRGFDGSEVVRGYIGEFEKDGTHKLTYPEVVNRKSQNGNIRYAIRKSVFNDISFLEDVNGLEGHTFAESAKAGYLFIVLNFPTVLQHRTKNSLGEATFKYIKDPEKYAQKNKEYLKEHFCVIKEDKETLCRVYKSIAQFELHAHNYIQFLKYLFLSFKSKPSEIPQLILKQIMKIFKSV